MKILLPLLSLLLVAGCQRLNKPPVSAPSNSATSIGNTSDAVARLAASNQEIGVASARREAAISAYLEAAMEVLAVQASSPAITTVQVLVALARKSSLQPPDALKLSAARNIAQLRATGLTEKAKTEEEKLVTESIQAEKLDAELKATRQKLEDALESRITEMQKERAESTRRNQEAMNALAAEINDLRTSHTRNLQVWTARILVGAGILGIAGSGALIWLTFSVNPLKAVTRALPLVAGSLLSIGCGFIVSQPWFIWAVGVTIIVIIIGVVVLLRHGRNTNRTLTTTLRKTIQSAEEQQVENPAAALDFKEYQQDNLDDAEKRLVDDMKPSIDRSYINEVQKTRAINLARASVTPGSITANETS